MKRFSLWQKRVLIGGGLLLLVGGVGLMARSVLVPSPLLIPAPAPLPSPNGFDIYVAAAQLVVPANPPVDEIDDRTVRTPQQAAILYAPVRRSAWIVSNAPAWTLMAQAKTLPARSPSLRGSLAPFPAWAQLRELARCQSIRVKDAKARGQWGEATDLGIDGIEMGRNVEHGAALIGSLVAMAIEAIGQRSLEDVPPHLDGAQAKAATRRIETMLAKAQPFSEVLREEKWGSLTLLRVTLSGGQSSGLLTNLIIPRAQTDTATMMDGFIGQADKPTRAQASLTPPSGIAAIYMSPLFPVMKRSYLNDARRKAGERLLLLRLALRAYRVERGAYPATLAGLTPAYLQTVPVDPFGGGEAFHYRTSGDSYTAWSIGPDGIDNGGAPVQPRSGQKRAVVDANSKGDVVAVS